MPLTAKPFAARKIAKRSRRQPRRVEPGKAASRRLRRVAPKSGATTHGTTIHLLQEAVEILQGRAAVYERHYLAQDASNEQRSGEKLRELANAYLTHSRWLEERIAELGGNRKRASRREVSGAAHAAPPQGNSLLQADITFSDAVIDKYGSLLTLVGESDLTTKFLIEDILFDELEHSRERRAWLAG